MTPHDKYCSPRPEFLLHEYDGSVPMYRSTVLLPVTVPGNCRKIEGPSCISKKMARRLVSFAAVKMLFEMGELDSLFRPSYLALDSTGNIKPEITNLSSAVRTVRMGVSDGLQGDWDGQEEFYLSSLRVTVFEDGLKNCSLCPEMDDMDCLMDVVQTQQEQPQQQQQQQQQKKDGDEDAEIVWGESSRETLATTTTSITPVTTTTAATTANTSATSSSSVPLPLFNNALYHYLPKSSIVGKTFDVGILTIGRVQDADKDMLRMVLPFQERLNTTLSLEMVHYAGRGPIKLSQETLRQIRIFHTLSFAALLREEILPSMDFAYMLAPVKNNNCFAGDETDFTRTVPPAELDVTLLKTVYEANCKYEHKSNMNLPLFRALLARYVTAVEDIKKEHGSAKDVEKVSLPRQRISMEKTNRRASSSSSSSSSSNLSLSVKQNQGKETNEEAGGEGNTSNEDQTPMVVDGKEDSSPVDATASSDASTGAINALANTPTQPESIHHQPSPHEALVASLIEKIPKPFYKHAREGSVLELMTDKPGFDAQRDLIDSDMVMIDFYYYARKFVPLEVLDLGPFDTVAPLSLGPNFKHTSVAEFYQKRLNCWETIDPNQRVIRAFHMPQMTLLQRNQANYKTEMARITDLQFPRYRPSRCEIVYLLPQFGRIYPIPRPLLLNDIRHAPILCRQFEHVMITRDVQRQFSLEFVPVIELQTALTAPSAHLPYDYERLELFGDSFLKILFTLHIFAKYPTYHEGRLTSIRYKLEGNRHFTAQASRSCVLPAILTDSLTRLLWHPLIRYVAGTEEEEKARRGEEKRNERVGGLGY